MAGQDAMIRRAIAAMGSQLGPDPLAQCRALFDAEQRRGAMAPLAADCAYGDHPRQRLDLYGDRGGALRPVLLFVHGGGFVQGDKGGADSWANAAVGWMAARRGWIGAVINYRLAPDHPWPAGSEDVAGAIAWLRAHVAGYGGDPARIVAMGTSAGAVHVAGMLRADPAPTLAGAVLLSGLYGHTPLDPRDQAYYGAPDLYAARAPGEAVAATRLPLLIACAEHDPARFQAEFVGLIADRLAQHGTLGRAMILPGHNHYTMAMHLGTGDTRLEQAIADFIEDLG